MAVRNAGDRTTVTLTFLLSRGGGELRWPLSSFEVSTKFSLHGYTTTSRFLFETLAIWLSSGWARTTPLQNEHGTYSLAAALLAASPALSPARKCFLVLIARCEAGSGLHPCPLQRAPSFLAACVNPCPHRHLLTHPFQIFSSASRRWRIPSKCRHTAKENYCHSLTFSHHLSFAASRCSSPQWRQMTKQQGKSHHLD